MVKTIKTDAEKSMSIILRLTGKLFSGQESVFVMMYHREDVKHGEIDAVLGEYDSFSEAKRLLMRYKKHGENRATSDIIYTEKKYDLESGIYEYELQEMDEFCPNVISHDWYQVFEVTQANWANVFEYWIR